MNALRDIWSVLTAQQKRSVLAGQVVALLMAFSTAIGVVSIAPFFSVLGDPQLIERNAILRELYRYFGYSSTRSFAVALGLGFMVLVLFSNLVNLFGSSAMHRLAWRIGSELQAALFAEYMARPYLFHVRTHSSVLIGNIVMETSRATNEILYNGLLLVTNLITAVCIIVAMLLIDPAIAVTMVAALIGGYALIYYRVRNSLLRCGQAQSEAVIAQTRIVGESFEAIKEISVLGIQDFFRAAFERATRTMSSAVTHTEQVSQSPGHIMECLAAASLVGLALALSHGDERGAPWLGNLTFAGFAVYRLLPALQQAFASIARLLAARQGFASIVPDLRQARVRKQARRSAAGKWQKAPQSEIALRDVSFGYVPERSPAVSGIDLRIAAGSVIGLVGANGSGKTTLVDLIAGLLVPQSGEVRVDGTALSEADLEAWRSRIAYVPQHIVLLDSSVAQNVALGVAPASIDRKRLHLAAQLSRLDEVVRGLPDGYDHRVGERGVRLSGGQRQRIGIARALYTEASVLILDEATSALDNSTERETMSAVTSLRGRYTIILVAHRSSALPACDSIVELQNGRITAAGTYEELLGSSERFRRLAGYG